MSVAVPVVDSWNGDTRRIYLKQGVTTFHWIEDVYKEYRNWRRTAEVARVWDPLMRAAGNDPKGGGKYTPRYVTLLDGCRVVPYDENILIEVTGEAITDNADVDPDPFDTSTRTQPLKLYITPPASELVRAEAELEAVKQMEYSNRVCYQAGSGNTGTTWPLGTRRYPLESFADIFSICIARGFNSVEIIDNLTTQATDNIAGYVMIGQDPSSTLLSLTSGNNTTAVKLKELTATGTCGGRMDMENCHLTNIVDLCASGGDANLTRCKLMNSIQLNSIADQTYSFDQCIGSGGATAPTLDVNGCSADIDLSCYSGSLSVTNMTNPGCNLSIDINSGHITLDASITQGNIIIRGIAKFTNNTTPQAGLTIDISGLQLPVNDQYGGTVYMDTTGRAGDDYPSGLWYTPATTVPDGLTLSDKFNCNKLHFHSDMTFPATADLTALIIESHSTFIHTLTFEAGVVTLNSIFRHARLTGAMNGKATYDECLLSDISGIAGCMQCGVLEGTVALIDDASHVFAMKEVRSLSQVPSNFDVNASGVNCVGYAGMVNIRNKTGAAEVNLHCEYGVVWIDATCTGGTIYLAGTGILMADNSGPGCTVVNQMADPTAVVDANITHVIGDPIMAGSTKETNWGGTA